jgi:hypothetical protein
MIEYRIVIRYEGTKAFKVSAEDFEEALKIAQRGPQHITNEIYDGTEETIIKIERIEKE